MLVCLSQPALVASRRTSTVTALADLQRAAGLLAECQDRPGQAIALRTLLIKNDRVYIQAGGGVVADSDPGAEYEESVNKARAMIRALSAAREFELAAARGR